MSTQNLNEIWQVEVGGQIYEAPFVELGDWIGEGSLLPQDKVRKGNLRWIEARRVPNLVPFFNAKEQGLPMPVMVSTVDAAQAEQPAEASAPVNAFDATPPTFDQTVHTFAPPVPDPVEHTLAVPAEPQGFSLNPDFCALHNDIPT